jgi:hypothetical protein
MSIKIKKQIEKLKDVSGKLDLKSLDSRSKKVIKEAKEVIFTFQDIFENSKNYNFRELQEVRFYFNAFNDEILRFCAKINHSIDITQMSKEK